MKDSLKFAAAFPAALSYPFRPPAGKKMVREPDPCDRNDPVTERHLQCVWFDESLRPQRLATNRGEEVIVEHPGRWNLEAGPDFLDATLRIGKDRRFLKGDVEIHIRPSDWTAHGHGRDPAYSRVVAHVTFAPGALADSELPAGAAQVSMRDALKTMPSFAFEYLDVTAYPYAKLSDRRAPCAALLAGRSVDEWLGLLESAGHERLRLKAEKLESAIADRGAEQVFYEEVMAALGYKHNKIPFRKLASAVPLSVLEDECRHDSALAYGLLLGVAGLMPPEIHAGADTETKRFMRTIWGFWWRKKSSFEEVCLAGGAWKLSSLRPQNHPARRLAAAASIFTGRPGILKAIGKIPAGNGAWFKDACRVFEERASGLTYWQDRLTLGGKAQRNPAAILGQTRISAILSNVVVPFLAASGKNTAPLLDSLPPEEDNSIIRHTAYALFGRDHNPALYRRGILQQGLIQIFHDFCVNNHADCAECGLAQQLEQTTAKVAHWQ